MSFNGSGEQRKEKAWKYVGRRCTSPQVSLQDESQNLCDRSPYPFDDRHCDSPIGRHQEDTAHIAGCLPGSTENKAALRAEPKDRRRRENVRKHLIAMRIARTVVFAVTFALAVSGAGPERPLTKTELKRLIANAQTKTDHERIAQYFEAEAAVYEVDAKDHAELAQLYKKKEMQDADLSKHPPSLRAFEHGDALFRSLQKAAEQARNLAAEHRGMAHEAKK